MRDRLFEGAEPLRRKRDEHQYGELAAEPRHPADFDIAAAVEEQLGDFVNDPDPVGAGQGENDTGAHRATSFRHEPRNGPPAAAPTARGTVSAAAPRKPTA